LTDRGTQKYLARYAEPEARLAEAAAGAWARALCVPACGEAPTLLEGFRDAAQSAHGRTLIILVVNAPGDAPESMHAQNRRLLDASGGAGLHPDQAFDVWVVDRASPEHRLPAKQGVGLARRIACDLALALRARGCIADRFCYFTDADVTLPHDYFERAAGARADVSAIVFPFWHVPSGEPELDRATALYEVSLRYYVLGLGHARSPYALHTLGSTLAVDFGAYAAVRGVPRRAAGEDFHLLAKLLKVAPVLRADGKSDPVRIVARQSSRVPFGTGAGVAKLTAGAPLELYHPQIFDILGELLDALDAFAADRDLRRLFARARRSSDVVEATLREWGAERTLGELARQAPSADQLERRVHEWLDALRTLKLVHALRAKSHSSPLYDQALRQARFVGTDLNDLDRLRQALFAGEPSGLVGPTLSRKARA
jgi:hypothetical protein